MDQLVNAAVKKHAAARKAAAPAAVAVLLQPSHFSGLHAYNRFETFWSQ